MMTPIQWSQSRSIPKGCTHHLWGRDWQRLKQACWLTQRLLHSRPKRPQKFNHTRLDRVFRSVRSPKPGWRAIVSSNTKWRSDGFTIPIFLLFDLFATEAWWSRAQMEVSGIHVSNRFNFTKLSRKHVLTNLEPYICTFCPCGLDSFSSQHAWFEHELIVHRTQWLCSQCRTTLKVLDDFKEHVSKQHQKSVSASQLCAWIDQPKRSIDWILSNECPFCNG